MVRLRALRRCERRSAGRSGHVEPHAGGEVPGSLPVPVLGSREGLDRTGRAATSGTRLRSTGSARSPGVRLGAREHPHAPCGVAEVLPDAPLDQGTDGQLQFDLGLIE